MCGRYTLFTPAEALEQRFHATMPVGLYEPHWNIPPAVVRPVLRNDHPDRFDAAVWGFLPHWARGGTFRAQINARAETVAERRMFGSSFKRYRCLIPADGFYEWKQEGSQKRPYYIALKDGSPFAFAGIWTVYEGDEGDVVPSFAIITTAPNSLMRDIHNRMPVMLQNDAEAMWLDTSVPLGAVQKLLAPYPASAMHAYAVSTAVNRPRYDVPEAITPVRSSASWDV